MTAAFSPASFASPGSGTTTITLTATASAAPMSGYFVVAALNNGTVVNAAPITLSVTATPNFSLAAASSSVHVPQAGSGTVALAVGSFSGGFNSPVALTVSGLPSGMTAKFSPTSLSASVPNSTLQLAASSTVKTGTYSVTVTGTGGSISKSVSVAVTVAVGATK